MVKLLGRDLYGWPLTFRWIRRRRSWLVLVLALASLAGCENRPTPDDFSGPAFELTARPKESTCGEETCVRFEVLNRGEAGAGNCRLYGSEPGESVPGPAVQLPVVQSGETHAATLRWSGDVPSQGLRVICEPGIRS